MALRLTGTSPAAPDAATGNAGALPSSAPALQALLQTQAGALLSTGQLAGYRDLFTRAAEHEDPHARYAGRLVLLAEGLAAAGRTSSSTQALALFLSVAEAGLAALEEEPREPMLLGYAAIALYELWSLDAARALFQAAHRLDPALPHVRRNLEECRRRGREAGRARLMAPLHPTVPALARRAKRVAAEARPAKGLTLSLCMIVRDEEEMLPRCLAAAAPAVDEIVIVDTGSRDRTVEIARSFGARVIEREWTGSFSEARNVSFEAATGDWLMYLDADEVLVSEDAARLRALTGRVWREAFYLVETSYTGEIGHGTAMANNALRVFRNRPHYRFEGRLHEQIAQHLPVYAPGRIEQTSIRVDHYGYLGAVRGAREKSQRNLELLRKQQAESGPSAFLHFNLGTERSAIGDARGAAAEFDRAWQMAKAEGEQDRDYAPTLILRLVNALRQCGEFNVAIERAQEGLTQFPGFTDLVFAQGLASLAGGREDDAIAAWRQCIEMGEAPGRYGSTVGSGTFLPRISLAELHLSRRELEPARELLEWCVSEHPGFVGLVAPYARVLLCSAVAPDLVAEEIEARLELTPAARFMLAGTLYGHGAMEAAERQYRALLAGRPHSSHARAQLAEALLHQRRYSEAAGEAALIPEDDPFAALACRIQLWGQIAGGDLASAHTLSARAAQAGVPEAELEVFAGWLELAEGGAEPRTLPVAAIPLLGVILETLLKVQDFETFETLIGLLHRSELPRREQRELLASMYLEHGFLSSAAQEWMAVCQAEGDLRAFLGLARVALAHDQPEDAAVFASEALRLDSANAAAWEILARCPGSTAAEAVPAHPDPAPV